jgi:hypothetical protein
MGKMGAILHALWLKFGLAASATALGAAVVTAAALPGALHTEVVGLLEPTSATVLVRLGPADFDKAIDRVVLRGGDAVRTDATGRALLTYADGATLVIEPNSEIVIESLEQSGRDVIVLISQTAGRVWYQLSRGMSQTARYEIRSGALAAVVRAGSTVEVAVAADGSTTVTTAEGVAQASAGGSTVAVTTGTSTTVTPSGTPAPLAPSSATPPPSVSRSPSAQAPSGSTTERREADDDDEDSENGDDDDEDRENGDDDDDEDREKTTRPPSVAVLPMPTLPHSTRPSKGSTRRQRAATPKPTPVSIDALQRSGREGDDEDNGEATRRAPARVFPMPTLPPHQPTRTSNESTRRQDATQPKLTPEPLLRGAPVSAPGVTVTINVNGSVQTLELTRLPSLTEGRHLDANLSDNGSDEQSADDDQSDDDNDDQTNARDMDEDKNDNDDD